MCPGSVKLREVSILEGAIIAAVHLLDNGCKGVIDIWVVALIFYFERASTWIW